MEAKFSGFQAGFVSFPGKAKGLPEQPLALIKPDPGIRF
jgi:hypothetical protein